MLSPEDEVIFTQCLLWWLFSVAIAGVFVHTIFPEFDSAIAVEPIKSVLPGIRHWSEAAGHQSSAATAMWIYMTFTWPLPVSFVNRKIQRVFIRNWFMFGFVIFPLFLLFFEMFFLGSTLGAPIPSDWVSNPKMDLYRRSIGGCFTISAIVGGTFVSLAQLLVLGVREFIRNET